jgi:ATP-dependent helicase HrpB
MTLPISQIKDEILFQLKKSNSLVLQAPTGSGKSTQVPQFLLDHFLPGNKNIIILQPRRIAARMLASYIARSRNSILGDEIGYQVRLDSKAGPQTRVLFVTEGILAQRLLRNDTLQNTDVIIFDEFHERHIETDLCLALARKLQKSQRPDLKIIVMSATLETSRVQEYLQNCPVIKSDGRMFPVEIKYHQPKPHELIWETAAQQIEGIKDIVGNNSILVFMPGAFEIQKTIESIQKRPGLSSFTVLPLHGSLTHAEQDEAVKPGMRRIIISSNVAETSLTIPGITVVIDSGLAKTARFDAKRGINTLFQEPISKSSADQRAGRAGRTAPGMCIRLWSEFSQNNKIEQDSAEIHRIDLTEVVLGLIASGISSVKNFEWFENPASSAITHSLELLQRLEAIDPDSVITPQGKIMARFNMHPRFSRMLSEAYHSECLPLACVLSAITQTQGIFYNTKDEVILNERKHLFGDTSSDLIFELNAWLWAGKQQFKASACNMLGINANAARKIAQLALILLKNADNIFNISKSKIPETISYDEEYNLRKCLFKGFSDFIAVRHRFNSATCQMPGGKSGQLNRESIVQDSKFLVATELEENKTPTGVQLFLKKVSAVEEAWITENKNIELYTESKLILDTQLRKIVKITEYSWEGLILKRENSDPDNSEEVSELIAQKILDNELELPLWDENVEHYINRINFASANAPQYEIPPVDTDARMFILQQSVYGITNIKELAKCDPWPAVKGWLNYLQSEAVNTVAPETIELPHKKRPAKLRYTAKGEVILSETIQAMYDCPLPITVAEGKVPVIFELLAPSRRPVQITSDLEYFWKNSYLEIKKELKGRYPKHEWR